MDGLIPIGAPPTEAAAATAGTRSALSRRPWVSPAQRLDQPSRKTSTPALGLTSWSLQTNSRTSPPQALTVPVADAGVQAASWSGVTAPQPPPGHRDEGDGVAAQQREPGPWRHRAGANRPAPQRVARVGRQEPREAGHAAWERRLRHEGQHKEDPHERPDAARSATDDRPHPETADRRDGHDKGRADDDASHLRIAEPDGLEAAMRLPRELAEHEGHHR